MGIDTNAKHDQERRHSGLGRANRTERCESCCLGYCKNYEQTKRRFTAAAVTVASVGRRHAHAEVQFSPIRPSSVCCTIPGVGSKLLPPHTHSPTRRSA